MSYLVTAFSGAGINVGMQFSEYLFEHFNINEEGIMN